MSHVSDVRLKIRDLDALERALPPELELRKGKTSFAWWGSFMGDSTPPAGRNPRDYGRCDHAIGYKGVAPRNGASGEWEIGVCKALDNDGYDLLLDSFGSAGAKLTKHVPGIRREYAVAVATQTAISKLSRHGWKVGREDLPGNRIRLHLRHR